MAYNIVVISGKEWSELWRTTVVLQGANISWVQNLTHKQVEWFLKGGTPQCNIAYKCISYMSIILVDGLRVCSVLDTLPMKRVSTSTFQVCKNCTLRRVPWFFPWLPAFSELGPRCFPPAIMFAWAKIRICIGVNTCQKAVSIHRRREVCLYRVSEV